MKLETKVRLFSFFAILLALLLLPQIAQLKSDADRRFAVCNLLS